MTNKTQVHVKVDTNEASQKPMIINEVKNHTDVASYEPFDLPAADLEIDGIGFERKTVADYSSSMQSDRMDRQLRNLTDRYDVAYILVEGNLSETNSPFATNMHGASLRGHMAALTARNDTSVHSVIPCSNLSLTVDMAVRMARKHTEESDREFIPQPVSDPGVPTAIMMYGCIPNVGPNMARKLYDAYPSVTEFIRKADRDSLQEIDGIGPKLADDIINGIM